MITRHEDRITPFRVFVWTFLLVLAFLALFCSPAGAQVAKWEKVQPPVLHQGNWQSCKDQDGLWGERVLEHVVLGTYAWEIHLGPKDEFAVYDHKVDSPEHTHDGKDNLLGTAYRISDVQTWRAKRNWTVPSLHIWVSIMQAGGSRNDCKSFYVRIERRK